MQRHCLVQAAIDEGADMTGDCEYRSEARIQA